jgi:hypothetical protein
MSFYKNTQIVVDKQQISLDKNPQNCIIIKNKTAEAQHKEHSSRYTILQSTNLLPQNMKTCKCIMTQTDPIKYVPTYTEK